MIKFAKSNTKGEAYVDTIIKIIVFFLLLVLVISVLPILSYKQAQDKVADRIVRSAEQIGTTSSYQVNDAIDSGIADGITITNKTTMWEGTKYIPSTKNIQLNDKIVVTIKSKYVYKFMGLEIPFTVTSKVSGVSERYFK